MRQDEIGLNFRPKLKMDFEKRNFSPNILLPFELIWHFICLFTCNTAMAFQWGHQQIGRQFGPNAG
jgi:hypothetical protein